MNFVKEEKSSGIYCYNYNDSSKTHEVSRMDINRLSCDFSSDSENVKYEKYLTQRRFHERQEQEARDKLERERKLRKLEQQERIYDNLLSAIKRSDNPEEYSHVSLDYEVLRNGRTLEKLKTTQKERRQELEKEIRNILVIGYTGSGKSTLCNVLANKDNEFTEIFKESDGHASGTRSIQAEVFEHKRIKYRVIDTIGFGDTKLKPREIILAIAESYKKIENGLNQVFFVINQRFDPKTLEMYKTLRSVLFDEGITDYITVVGTHANYFKDKNKCKEAVQKLIEEDNKEVIEIIKLCGERFIHVNNPSIDYEEDDDSIKKIKEKREESRKILLNHLESCRKVYKPKDSDEINKKIDRVVIREIKNLRKEKSSLEEELRKTEMYNSSEKVQSTKDRINAIEEQIEIEEALLEESVLSVIGKKIDELLKRIS
ncbi:6340_t:CDS:1, partial [Acaulospora colombiana]